jgi:hypothetical protein
LSSNILRHSRAVEFCYLNLSTKFINTGLVITATALHLGTILKIRFSCNTTLRRWVSISRNSESFVLLSRTQESNILSRHSSTHLSPVVSLDSTVGLGPALQVRRSRVQFLMASLILIIDLVLQALL